MSRLTSGWKEESRRNAEPHRGDAMTTDHLEHLKMIQTAIARMAQNSFVTKGWSVTLVTGALALTVTEKQHALVFLGIVPVLAFWSLDAFYLLQERRFRVIHDQVLQDAAA